jgi:signal peptidase
MTGALRASRTVAVAALWAALGLGAGLVALAGAPRIVGLQSFPVMSGSMEPAISTGDVVVERRIHPLQARVGDVVTFKDTARGELVTHRVRSMRTRGAAVAFVTQGDANTGMEHWRVRTGGTIGRVLYHVPRIGYGIVWARRPIGRLILVVFPALLLGVLELARIWGPRSRRAEEVAS